MLFNSLTFIFAFLPLAVAGFHVARRQSHQAGEWWLLGASLVFYAWWNPYYLVLLGATILFNYGVGVRMLTLRKMARPTGWWFAFGIAVNLLSLAYFKYANFFMDSLNDALGTSFVLERILLPLAISFITFQKIAFLADVRSGRIDRLNLRTFALFAAFFPQLIAGPIVRYDELYTQLLDELRARRMWLDIGAGLALFAIGLLKKVGLADYMADNADPAFTALAQGVSLSFVEAWSAALCFAFQIYFDFSGYSDMAGGLARMFGVRLPLNFNSPYKSASVIEFWRRWHISLSRFLRNHLYIPLGGSRRGPLRRNVNLMATMMLGGLWHGANWTFLIWGGLHGAYLIANHSWRAMARGVTMPRAVGLVLTMLAVVVAWVFFRAESVGDSVAMLQAMAGSNGVALPITYGSALGPIADQIGLTYRDLPFWAGLDVVRVQLLALLVVFALPNSAELMARYRLFHMPEGVSINVQPTWASWRLDGARWLLTLGLLVAGLLFLVNGRANEFIYFQF